MSDATNADLFDVAITVTNAGTGISSRVKTDEYGKYVVESLLPGSYTIRAEGEGLKPNQVTGVKLEAAEDHTVNLVMESAKERILPRLARPKPISMAELAKVRTAGVSAVEVSDYVYGNYQGPLAPSPPPRGYQSSQSLYCFLEGRSLPLGILARGELLPVA